MAIIGDVIPTRQRSKYQAGIGIVATLALIAGPLPGGLFYVYLPIGVAAFLIVGARLHLPRHTCSATPSSEEMVGAAEGKVEVPEY